MPLYPEVPASSGIPATIVDAKGDLIAATGADTVDRLAADSNGKVLTAADGETTGLAWSPPIPVGSISDFAGITLPSYYLWADGSSVSRTTYASLFAALTENKGTVTVTLASPGVWTLVGHGLSVGDAVFVSTTGALPTGMTADVTRYVMTVPTADTFTLGTTRTISALTNVTSVTTAVNTSVSQSGTHTLYLAPYGSPDSSNFYLPDARSRVLVGMENMNNSVGTGGGDAGRTTVAQNLGSAAGEEFHVITDAELSSHSHTGSTGAGSAHSHGPSSGTNFVTRSASGGSGFAAGSHVINTGATATATESAHTHSFTTDVTGSDAGHNNMQPYLMVNKIIYAGV